MNAGLNIKKFREGYDLSQVELAKRVGVSQVTISKIEKGFSFSFSVGVLLAEALGVSLDDIAGRTSRKAG